MCFEYIKFIGGLSLLYTPSRGKVGLIKIIKPLNLVYG